MNECLRADIHSAHSKLEQLWAKGYSAGDIVQTFSRVTQNMCVRRAWGEGWEMCVCAIQMRARARI